MVGGRILVMGLAFNENCPDLRNSKVIDAITALEEHNARIDVIDPWAHRQEARREFGLDLLTGEAEEGVYDAIVKAAGHRECADMGAARIRGFGKPGAIFFDVKGVFGKTESDGRL